MKQFAFVLVCVMCLAPVPAIAAKDAAVEAQEGSVDHWIDYYRKERAGSNRTVIEETPSPEKESSGTGGTESEKRPEDSPANQSGDH